MASGKKYNNNLSPQSGKAHKSSYIIALLGDRTFFLFVFRVIIVPVNVQKLSSQTLSADNSKL